AATTLSRAADAWADRAGGTSGALWGVILNAIASHLGDAGRPDAVAVASGVADGLQGVMTYGKAEVGDKTLVDALVPFSSTLAAEVDGGSSFVDAWQTAADAATRAAAATAALLPRLATTYAQIFAHDEFLQKFD
ncbi:DAK2 domain-containing protein, partial [Microbacterium sp. K24]|uniref:DAK2 domain-containing protein n=1 Tax=Microbacterium sp. K24 TaxID=2305446 RepID=UPI00109C6C93